MCRTLPRFARLDPNGMTRIKWGKGHFLNLRQTPELSNVRKHHSMPAGQASPTTACKDAPVSRRIELYHLGTYCWLLRKTRGC